MGISGFFYYLKNSYKKTIRKDNSKKYDYLVLDVHSFYYNIKSLYEEVNYLIRLLFHAKKQYSLNNDYFFNDGKEIYEKIKYIFTTYKNLFPGMNKDYIIFIERNIEDSKSKINLLLEIFPISSETVTNATKLDVIEHIEELTIKYTKTRKNSSTLIYFDGIPSIAKMKEQLHRRIGMSVSKIINEDILKLDARDIEVEIQKKLITNFPAINLNEPILNETRGILTAKGFIINNKLKYGEAEHQIMTDLRNEKFKNKSILLSSPDADLILLNMITKVINNVSIDIYRESILTPSNFEFWDNVEESEKRHKIPVSYYGRDIHFILIDKLIESFNLVNSQEILDFAYLCLLLGDDFIPIIKTLSVKILPHLIETYKKINKPILKADYSGVNYENLIEYINALKEFENDMYIDKMKKNNKKINDRLKESQKKYQSFIKFMKINDNITIKKLFYLENGIVVGSDGNLKLLIQKFNEDKSKLSEDKMTNYLQGYQFIFDLYFKSDIKNYKWLYKYDEAPTLDEIHTYLKDKNSDQLNRIFDYSQGINIRTDLKYFDFSTYKKYIDDNKNNILRNIIKKIIIETGIKPEVNIDTIPLTPEILSKYITYRNIETIYKCHNALYIQGCLNSDVLMSNPLDYDTDIKVELLGGGVVDNYYQKYLKYKNKYLTLKNNIY